MKQLTTIFQWLNEITTHKTPVHEISEESWDKFNSYMIHRYVSMDMSYIDIVNYDDFKKLTPKVRKKFIQFTEK